MKSNTCLSNVFNWRNILNLAARIPKMFSIIRLVLESLYLKTIMRVPNSRKSKACWESIIPNKNIMEQKLTFAIVLLWLRQTEVIICY